MGASDRFLFPGAALRSGSRVPAAPAVGRRSPTSANGEPTQGVLQRGKGPMQLSLFSYPEIERRKTPRPAAEDDADAASATDAD